MEAGPIGAGFLAVINYSGSEAAQRDCAVLIGKVVRARERFPENPA
jgi:hypothetical protein